MHRSKLALASLAIVALASLAGRSGAQTLNTLTSFDAPGGIYPANSVMLNGSTLYGTTFNGGPNGVGTVFSLPVTGGTATTLGSFSGSPGGAIPYSNLSLTLSGSTLYGMTNAGGTSNDGTIFSIPIGGGTPTTVASLNGTNGAAPNGSLTLSADGSTLYGMTSQGGANGVGTIFSIPVGGSTPTVLASFTGATAGSDSGIPYGDLTLIGGTLYGMTSSGGTHGDGTIFSIPTSGGAITTLASFNGTDGAGPHGSLTLSGDGSTFYGLTSAGGASSDGTIFSVPVGGGAIATLASFNGTNGKTPYGDVTLVGSTLYGLTSAGGANSDGTLFSIPAGGGLLSTLVSFNGTNGALPEGSLTLGGLTLYGLTLHGGAHSEGTAFAVVLPEPSSLALLGLGAIALGALRLRRRSRHATPAGTVMKL